MAPDGRIPKIVLMASILLFLVSPACAAGVLWNYTTPNEFGVPAVAISSDGSSVASGGDSIQFLDAEGRKLWGGYAADFLWMDPAGTKIIAATENGMKSIDRAGNRLWEDTEYFPVTDMEVSSGGGSVVSLAKGMVSVYSTGGSVRTRNLVPAARSVGISDGGYYVIIGTHDQVLGYTDRNSSLWETSLYGVNQVLVTPNTGTIVAASDYTVAGLDSGGEILWKYRTGGDVRALAASADGTLIAAGSRDRNLYVLNSSGGLLWQYRTGDWVNAVAISPDGSLVAAGGNDRRLHLLDGEGRPVLVQDLSSRVLSLAISADGSRLVVGTGDGRIHYFSTDGGTGKPPVVSTPKPAATTAQATTPAVSPRPAVTKTTVTASPVAATPKETTPRLPPGSRVTYQPVTRTPAGDGGDVAVTTREGPPSAFLPLLALAAFLLLSRRTRQ